MKIINLRIEGSMLTGLLGYLCPGAVRLIIPGITGKTKLTLALMIICHYS